MNVLAKKSIIKRILTVIFGGLIGAGGLLTYQNFQTKSAVDVEVHQGATGFINPLLECDGANFKEVKNLDVKVSSLIETLKKEHSSIREVAVYYRDLNNGPWFGINEKTDFIGGSLLKIAILISYLKTNEFNPQILTTKLEYRPIPGLLAPLPQKFEPKEKMILGQQYTVEEMLRRMIVYSDNDTVPILLTAGIALPPDKVIREMGVESRIDKQLGTILNVRSYSSFFRILYNASYLNRSMSNYALELLSHTEFEQGLRAGVPGNIKISHKFGERLVEGDRQIHDCGIIYYPTKPYLLCVMTRGSQDETLVAAIREISKRVFETIDSSDQSDTKSSISMSK